MSMINMNMKLPEIDANMLDKGEYQKKITSYLYQLSEQLRYALSQMEDADEENADGITKVKSSLRLKVEKDGIISAINMSPEGIRIDSQRLNITGYVTFTDLAGAGTTVINGANIMTGTITASVIQNSMGNIGWTMSDGYLWGTGPTATSAGSVVCLKTDGYVAFACGMSAYSPGADTAIEGATIRLRHSGSALFKGTVEVGGLILNGTLNCGAVESTSYGNFSGTVTGHYLENYYGFYAISRDSNACANCSDGSNLASASYVRAQVESSDERLKIITGDPTDELIKAFRELDIKQFVYKPGAVITDYDDGKNRFGVLAQQMRQTLEKYGFSDAVYSLIQHREPESWSAPYIDDGDELKPDYIQMIPVLIYWNQQLASKIEELEARI